MASNYVVTSQTPGVQVLSPNEVIDIMEVGFVTKPSGVVAQREVPKTAWAAEGSDAWIGPLATAIEDLISGGLASGAVFVQDVDPATGLIVDAIEFVVSYSPPPPAVGPMTTTVVVPVNALTLDVGFSGALATFFPQAQQISSPADLLRAAYDTLVATAGL